ncbi:MAG: hypothetical protein V1494_03045 [Candidatus Diapherotrites archaeon]
MDLGIRQNKKNTGYSARDRIEYRCMNCGKTIMDPTGSHYARRFCSTQCKEEYVNSGTATDYR